MKLIAFAGQGTQWVGMGRDLYDHYAIARATFKEVDDTVGYNLSELIFHGPAEVLCKTEHAQVAIMATSIAILRVMQEQHRFRVSEDDILIGNSLGEYSALCAAGYLSLPECASLLHTRGTIMAKCANSQHTMAAVLGMTVHDLQALLKNTDLQGFRCEISNDNCPGQIVLSGDKQAFDILRPHIKKMVPLNVSGAFHSSYMTPAADQMRKMLCGMKFRPSHIRVISNYSLKMRPTKDNLARQIDSCVRFREGVLLAHELGVQSFVEIGPKAILANMITKTCGITGISICSQADLQKLNTDA